MRELYAPFQRNHERLIVMDVRSAELTKYAANAMLATRISFMNELANLAERLGADIEHVRRGIGADPRIGFHFPVSGRRLRRLVLSKGRPALGAYRRGGGADLHIMRAVEKVNGEQKRVLGERWQLGLSRTLPGGRFALWGLAFKPNTERHARGAEPSADSGSFLRAAPRHGLRSGCGWRSAADCSQGSRAWALPTRPLAGLDGAERWRSSPNGRSSAAPISRQSQPPEDPGIFDGRIFTIRRRSGVAASSIIPSAGAPERAFRPGSGAQG